MYYFYTYLFRKLISLSSQLAGASGDHPAAETTTNKAHNYIHIYIYIYMYSNQ